MRIIRRLIIFSFLAGLLAASSCARGDQLKGAGRDILVVVTDEGEHRFRVEVADTFEKQEAGLMYREHLDRDAGMLFAFGEPQVIGMWMKNTLIPLDMAFIKADGEIHRIAAMTIPQSLENISSGAPVVAVLEVNGGVFADLGIEAGDRVRHRIFEAD